MIWPIKPMMASGDNSVDYYELLQVSPNAEAETIQRVFRMLAQRFHPDNKETGNEQIFQSLLKAYQVLSDPVARAAFDVQHRESQKLNWKIFDQQSATGDRETEKRKREGILSLLYRKRMMQPEQPGMTAREMEGLLGIPKEHLEFSFWYLKESQFVKSGDNGRMLITIKGVEEYEEMGEGGSRHQVHMLPAPKESRADNP